jgi:hypothetical protein
MKAKSLIGSICSIGYHPSLIDELNYKFTH